MQPGHFWKAKIVHKWPRRIAATIGKFQPSTTAGSNATNCRGREPGRGRAGQQLLNRHFEAAFRPGKYFRRQSVAERLAQHTLADRLIADQCAFLWASTTR